MNKEVVRVSAVTRKKYERSGRTTLIRLMGRVTLVTIHAGYLGVTEMMPWKWSCQTSGSIREVARPFTRGWSINVAWHSSRQSRYQPIHPAVDTRRTASADSGNASRICVLYSGPDPGNDKDRRRDTEYVPNIKNRLEWKRGEVEQREMVALPAGQRKSKEQIPANHSGGHDAAKTRQQQSEADSKGVSPALPAGNHHSLSSSPPSTCIYSSFHPIVTMSGLSTTPRFLPPISPRRASSPTITAGGSEESNLRDMSPSTTLRAFTEKPVPFDTTRDEYKIFACIENLTPAERDLGARVAKAAQRLKSWCEEIDKWGWSGTFEQPSEAYRETRRRSVEAHIREHVKDSNGAIGSIGPLEYWGSLLSVEVEAHEARLDEISEELLTLDIEELKGHVLDIHGPNKSRPSSAGYEAVRQNYTLMDDFSIILTQTLISALPHHYQLGERLNTWTARVSILREAPHFLSDLQTSQKAMRLGWEALEPPKDLSDTSFNKWKEAVGTISGVLQGKVGDLGQRLDRMLDTLEGRDDCLPDEWIDNFEGLEADYGQWAHVSRRRIIEFDVRRKVEQNGVETRTGEASERLHAHADHGNTMEPKKDEPAAIETTEEPAPEPVEAKYIKLPNVEQQRSVTAFKTAIPEAPRHQCHAEVDEIIQEIASDHVPSSPLEESVFEEGDTVVHNDLPESSEDPLSSRSELIHFRPRSISPVSLLVITTEEQVDAIDLPDIPLTPRSRCGSIGSISSSISFPSSPPGTVEESPSVRNATNRQAKPPPPALNAAMGKRRPLKHVKESAIDNTPPWPPTQFSKHLAPNSAEDLERKISDILTTIPAHIRLTSGPEPDAPEVKPGGRVTSKGSKGYLRASRSVSGMKSPQLTLSPAKQDFDSANAASGRRSSAALRGDNDIKLYHLTQPGKEHPVKLFIRRVGENGERVMVRVGGGWADLGEYLRQYAEHHGRRTVSEGKFEILGIEVKNPEVAPPRPESAMSRRDNSRRFSVGSPNSTPQKSAGVGLSRDDASSNLPNITNTPAGMSAETSAPSTGSSRHSWTGNEVGLAGPKSKKLDLSGEKLEWIEGMLNKARTASGNMTSAPRSDHTPKDPQTDRAESRSESRSGARPKPGFGDLGKIGGTKRVFMRVSHTPKDVIFDCVVAYAFVEFHTLAFLSAKLRSRASRLDFVVFAAIGVTAVCSSASEGCSNLKSSNARDHSNIQSHGSPLDDCSHLVTVHDIKRLQLDGISLSRIKKWNSQIPLKSDDVFVVFQREGKPGYGSDRQMAPTSFVIMSLIGYLCLGTNTLPKYSWASISIVKVAGICKLVALSLLVVGSALKCLFGLHGLAVLTELWTKCSQKSTPKILKSSSTSSYAGFSSLLWTKKRQAFLIDSKTGRPRYVSISFARRHNTITEMGNNTWNLQDATLDMHSSLLLFVLDSLRNRFPFALKREWSSWMGAKPKPQDIVSGFWRAPDQKLPIPGPHAFRCARISWSVGFLVSENLRLVLEPNDSKNTFLNSSKTIIILKVGKRMLMSGNRRVHILDISLLCPGAKSAAERTSIPNSVTEHASPTHSPKRMPEMLNPKPPQNGFCETPGLCHFWSSDEPGKSIRFYQLVCNHLLSHPSPPRNLTSPKMKGPKDTMDFWGLYGYEGDFASGLMRYFKSRGSSFTTSYLKQAHSQQPQPVESFLLAILILTSLPGKGEQPKWGRCAKRNASRSKAQLGFWPSHYIANYSFQTETAAKLTARHLHDLKAKKKRRRGTKGGKKRKKGGDGTNRTNRMNGMNGLNGTSGTNVTPTLRNPPPTTPTKLLPEGHIPISQVTLPIVQSFEDRLEEYSRELRKDLEQRRKIEEYLDGNYRQGLIVRIYREQLNKLTERLNTRLDEINSLRRELEVASGVLHGLTRSFKEAQGDTEKEKEKERGKQVVVVDIREEGDSLGEGEEDGESDGEDAEGEKAEKMGTGIVTKEDTVGRKEEDRVIEEEDDEQYSGRNLSEMITRRLELICTMGGQNGDRRP
ncbi:uncharacterized protein BDR25DRAFT_361154 [Lindgomyces ingoldianus]|uniref:Uncharacterized protein n=1 Tax=Lindgomyces ingoldianus TaxID=673940 RepID=A0ACB6QFM0_9PLEO|nr:uncharacterized protein BDR25DRAFT_361154 [Lindgomyces ingoldianus]KAF2464931.1 hypothetical protein BDR25DRAFT_361154 [Lindgomyces ingoldianus]